MEALIETILDKLKRLSSARLQTILEFVTFLDWQQARSEQLANDDAHRLAREQRLTLSRSAKGRFAHLPNSSAAFASKKLAKINAITEVGG
ncbi:hypothetical protein [Leptothoe spongobia]|uniref:DUF2281 domain-containing protein n=1 Tax=Leptothoe spongobia TAU-MAC 1115 TaxID=1967444 RepID=A0A947GEM4_9CYAN|nr:hypothetical protein [Leptothoe spongobia]MBT9314005.1 hypothetical protein [Leptothoe spongobia TAU-MAC 1115]